MLTTAAMQIVRGHHDVPTSARGAYVALGNFDGVHRGHRFAVTVARERGAALGAPPGVVTFQPHPKKRLAPDAPLDLLTPFRAKARLLAAAGAERLFALRFDRAMMAQSPAAFVDEVLIEGIGARGVVTGGDFRFGAKRAGDVAFLRARLAAAGVEYWEMPRVAFDGDRVASSRIRAMIGEGAVERAAEHLRQYFEVEGFVVHGDARGRTLGFPTANVRPRSRDLVTPAHGVYAVIVADAKAAAPAWRDGVANFGVRPTVDGAAASLEVHLLNESADLYGARLRVAFVERIRGEKRFASLDDLKAQIARDCAIARNIHKRR